MFSSFSNSGELTQRWEAFVKKPNKITARALTSEIEDRMSPPDGAKALEIIAEALDGFALKQRLELSGLLLSRLYEGAPAFLKASVAIRAEHSQRKPKTQPTLEPEPALQHDDILHALDLLPPAELPDLYPDGEDEPSYDRLLLEGLDLAGLDQETIDLIELEQRHDDVFDASSMGHLTAALDLVNSLSEKPSYSKARRGDLLKITKGTTQEHLLAQVGYRAARSQRDTTRGLSATNEFAATYWRTNFLDQLRVFLVKLKSVDMADGNRLVSSPRVLNKLEMIVGRDVVENLKIMPLDGNSGVSLLMGVDRFPSVDWKHVLEEIGATPSAYQLFELMDLAKKRPETDFDFDTWVDLITLVNSSAFDRLQWIGRGSGELAPVCAMVVHLVLGLADKRGPNRFDALTANAFRSLKLLLDIVVANESNPTTAMRAVELMMDEIGLIVAAAGIYHRFDYRETMRNVLLERAPSIAKLAGTKIEIDSVLTSSGMDSLGTALWIALWTRDRDEVDRLTDKIDYYETGFLLDKLKKGGRFNPRKDVLVAALNPSTPFFKPSAIKLIEEVLECLKPHKPGGKPFALILDTTIEIGLPRGQGATQLDTVLGGLKDAIADGQLEVFLCKSFQKYASFGTGKVAAGDLTMLSQKDNLKSVLARSEMLLQDLALDMARRDEGQLVVHMLRHGHRDELSLIRSAAANAKFVDEFCWPIDRTDPTKGNSYVDGIPLLLRSTFPVEVDDLFKKLENIDQRDSFSFLRTSFVGGIAAVGDIKGPFVRINTGHEQKEAMVEFFYAFGHLASGTLPGGEVGKAIATLSPLALSTVEEHLVALSRVPDTDQTGIARYRSNIIGSYCVFAVQNVPDRDSVMPLLIRYFGIPVSRGTIETQRYLARQLLSNVLLVFKDDPVTLTALYRAAAVLPSWEFKPIARELKRALLSAGESPEAKRLRALVDANS